MRFAWLALVLLGCGGHVVYDPVTHVAFGEVPVGQDARCDWDDTGSSITIDGRLEASSYRVRALEHELWHLLTRREDHGDDVTCISNGTGDLTGVRFACPVEVAEVNGAGRVVRLSFPQDPLAARLAAEFWNVGCGRECVVVEP